MKKLYIAILILAAGLTACKKSSSPNPGNNSDATANFQPTASGSNWNYQVSENFSPSSSLLLVYAEQSLGTTFPSVDTSYTESVQSTGTTVTVGAMNFSVFTQDSTTIDSIYTNLQDSDYYGIGVLPNFALSNGLGVTSAGTALLYLEDKPAGTTWSQNVISAGATAGTYDTSVYSFDILSIGGTRVVNGTTYQGVTEESIGILPGGLTALAGSAGIPSGINLAIVGDYYFARGVGLIEVDVNSSLYGFTYTELLTSATIKN
jgi:hypothetical protein